VPYLDQENVDESTLTPQQLHWRKHGYVVLKGFFADPALKAYAQLRERLNLGLSRFPTWTPYLEHEEVRNLVCSRELHYQIVDLIGEELGAHFCLSQYHSTERGWHQDDYLNPEDTYSKYCAVWIAIDDIHPDSGPFEFLPGTHKWPCMRRDLVNSFLDPSVRFGVDQKGGPTWEVYAEQFVNPAYYLKFKQSNIEPARFLGKRGDVLIWHGRLLHRGSPPAVKGMVRPGLIAHYSSIRTRRDIGNIIRRHGNGGYYWDN
jgi:hypothetical protein